MQKSDGSEKQAKGGNGSRGKPPWEVYLSEFLGTAALVAIGMSFLILDLGRGSLMRSLLVYPGARRALTGFLFGGTGGLIAFSTLGKISGAHINPAITLAFWTSGNMRLRHASGYILSQMAGAAAGALLLLSWGGIGANVQYGATTPGSGYTAWEAMLGETGTTFALVLGVFVFLGHPQLRNYTPLLFPFLYAFMVPFEAPLSGTSTNPARSFGPALVSGVWRSHWVYWAGPCAGALIAVGLHKFQLSRWFEVEVSKIHHLEHDPHGIFTYRRDRDD